MDGEGTDLAETLSVTPPFHGASKMKKSVLVVGILLLVIPSLAQAPTPAPPRKITVLAGGQSIATEVRSSLLPLISSNSRYQLVDNPNQADVQVRITCMPPTEGLNGIVCASLYLYGPPSYFGATTELSLSLTADSSPEPIAQHLVINLLEDTTTEELARADNTLVKIKFAMRSSR